MNTFTHTDEEGDVWSYQVIQRGSYAVLYFKAPERLRSRRTVSLPGDIGEWSYGHHKQIPDGWSLVMVARKMRELLTGGITIDEYNAALPST